jgi:hypothetical protein
MKEYEAASAAASGIPSAPMKRNAELLEKPRKIHPSFL